MKKNIIGSLLLSALVLSTGVTAMAAPSTGIETSNEAGKRESTSKVQVELQPGDDSTTPPVDPNEPDPGITDQKGPLSIDQVIIFNFESQKLASKTVRIPMKPKAGQTKLKPANIQITDKRGSGAGWNLQIKQSELISNVDGTERILKGAYIDMKLPTIKGTEFNSPDAKGPVDAKYDANYSNKGQFSKVITAEKDTGMGTWLAYYNDAGKDEVVDAKTGKVTTPGNHIKLVVPTGGYAGTYTGTVTWALSDSPEGTPA
ncbi:WxL domain-containing protein [Vagococcus silagei]|uniref:WxL domain-containing protein n=1 Tax=Vagococcus silagei TaxID=2508885 RepID=A0A4S3B025_9ENTE|nr:WxL domain-containing protein [Vagococcus silagei]THB60102.1 WxL domain-containing protein [Vagococcus silagei]